MTKIVLMKITINDKRKIFAIQEEFTHVFPYLKLEFFAKPHRAFGGSSKKIIKQNSKTLGDCRTIHKNGELNVTPSMTVSELERRLRDIYGLNAQVFRKSGKVWLETTLTDGWTLEEQNNQGESLSLYIAQSPRRLPN